MLSFSIWNHLKNNLFFKIWVMFSNINRYIFCFLAYNTLRAIVTLFFKKLFQSFFSDGKLIFSQLYLFIKDLIFVIPSRCFPICSWFNETVAAYWKHLLTFFLIGFIVVFSLFIQSVESLYDPTRIYFITFFLQ